MNCLYCGSAEFSPLGTLGRLHWFRCRQCGAENAATVHGGQVANSTQGQPARKDRTDDK